MSGQGGPACGLTDDGAILTPPPGRDLVFTKDTLIAGVHFRTDDPPEFIARKACRVNLSDLAAMGARPLGYLLALSLPLSLARERDQIEHWVKSFAEGLGQDQKEFGWSLYGGDTTATPGPLTLSITAIGSVRRGHALMRSGAQAGDDIYVSGTLGDAALGLKCLAGEITPQYPSLIARYHLPEPRLALGRKLWGIATAVLDISDGLAGDIRHICQLSGLGARMERDLIPLSPDSGKILESFPAYNSLIWNGGDDYELLFTASERRAEDITALAKTLNLTLTRIGRMTCERDIIIQDSSGMNLMQDAQGYRHF